MAVGFRREAAGKSKYIKNRARRGDRIGSARFHLADNRNLLGGEFHDVNGYLRVIQIMPFDQLVAHRSCGIAGGEARHCNVADADNGYRAPVRDTGVRLHLRRICHMDVQKVARCDEQTVLVLVMALNTAERII